MVARRLRRKPAPRRLMDMVERSMLMFQPEEDPVIPPERQADFTLLTQTMAAYVTEQAFQGPTACYHPSTRQALKTVVKRALANTAFTPATLANNAALDALMEAAVHQMPDHGITVSVFVPKPRKAIPTPEEVLIFAIENPGPTPSRR